MGKEIVQHTDPQPEGLDFYKVNYLSGDAHELPAETILIVSEPPSGKHKIYNFYAIKTGDKYHLVFEVENVPEL